LGEINADQNGNGALDSNNRRKSALSQKKAQKAQNEFDGKRTKILQRPGNLPKTLLCFLCLFVAKFFLCLLWLRSLTRFGAAIVEHLDTLFHAVVNPISIEPVLRQQ